MLAARRVERLRPRTISRASRRVSSSAGSSRSPAASRCSSSAHRRVRRPTHKRFVSTSRRSLAARPRHSRERSNEAGGRVRALRSDFHLRGLAGCADLFGFKELTTPTGDASPDVVQTDTSEPDVVDNCPHAALSRPARRHGPRHRRTDIRSRSATSSSRRARTAARAASDTISIITARRIKRARRVRDRSSPMVPGGIDNASIQLMNTLISLQPSLAASLSDKRSTIRSTRATTRCSSACSVSSTQRTKLRRRTFKSEFKRRLASRPRRLFGTAPIDGRSPSMTCSAATQAPTSP